MNAPALVLQLSHLIKQVFWVNYSPGVYFFRLNDLTYSDYDAIFTSGLVVNDLEFVIAVVFDGTVLVEVTSIVNCQNLQSSFYCSADELWIHSPLDADPYNHTVSCGKAVQIRRGGSTDEDLMHMEDRLLSVPNISKSLSDIFNSKIIFSGGGVTLNNADGFYDTFLEDEEIIGNKAKQYVKHPDTGEIIQAFSGFSEGGDLSTTELSLSIKDDKESLNVPIPPNVFTLAVYPYLDPSNADKPIPLPFGKCGNAELICSNELEPATGTFYFPCADTVLGQLHDVTAVLVDGVAVAYTKLLATNRFSLSSGVYAPGQKVTATIEGYEDSTGALMRNACDILKKLFIYFFGFADTSDFFDIWDTANAYNIYLFINEIKKFWEIVQIICKSSFLNLILNNNGTYSAFVNSETEDFIREIRNYEVKEFNPIEYKSDKLLSSVLIKYNQDHAENKWLQKKVNTGEATFFETYNQYAYKEFEVNLDNETDAEAWGAAVLDYFNTVQKPTKIKMDYLEARDLIIGKNYKIVFTRPRAPELGTYKVKLISTIENLNVFETECTFQLLEKLADDNELFSFGDCENANSPTLDGGISNQWDCTWARSGFRKHKGKYSWLMIKTGASGYQSIIDLADNGDETDMHGLVVGEKYILSFWGFANIAGNASNAHIKFKEYYDGEWYENNYFRCYQKNKWHKITGNMLLNPNTTGIKITVSIFHEEEPGTQFYIDDISLKYERK